VPIFAVSLQKNVIFNSVNSGFTGLNLIKFLHNAEKFMQFNHWKSELQYCNSFWNASTKNEAMSLKSPILRQKFVDWLPWQRPFGITK